MPKEAAERDLDSAKKALQSTEAARTLALRARAARDGANRRRELEQRIAEADTNGLSL